MTVDTGDVRLRTASEPARQHRLKPVLAPSEADPRKSGRHDRDRVIYSRSLLRLAGVTQVMTPSDEGALVHNRLTHSLKVAQVARAIAEALLARKSAHADIEALGGLDADVVEAAALAHDLGHPPFGHAGEVVLDRFARDRDQLDLDDGFEGNAQTFRILSRIEPRASDWMGMDVSAATLAAVLKYPWARHDAPQTMPRRLPKFGYYTADKEAFLRARAWLPQSYPADAQTLEAAVMDVADDIAYALHDLEDFRSAGLLSLREIGKELSDWTDTYGADLRQHREVADGGNRFGALRAALAGHPQYDAEQYANAIGTATNHLSTLRDASNPHWRLNQASSRQFVSKLITECLRDLSVNAAPTRQRPPVSLAPEHWHLIQILKQVTRDFVIGRADVAVVQRGQQRRLRELLELLHDWLRDKEDSLRVPPELRDLWKENGPRGLLDYVAGLTDRRAIALHSALTGEGTQSVLAGLAL